MLYDSGGFFTKGDTCSFGDEVLIALFCFSLSSEA
jgi:hypothetical protein